ncbi:MAG TPA: MFS transporter [Candidatus Angelobacter sp.]|jgi:MFS family permease|nr:MFS transporter [Candidatus Angelobacter sp.]
MIAIPQKSVRNLAIIYVAAWLRSFGIGLLGVVLGVFLYREGYSSTAIGLVIAAGLAGAATGTVFITFKADRLGRRRTLFVLSLLTAGGSLPLVFHFGLPAMVLIAFLGMLNGMGTDRSPAFALEQATIPGLVSDQKRTWALAWYSVVLDASGALGALAAGIPIAAQKWWSMDLPRSYRLLFMAYAAISVLTALLYLLLSSDVEIRKAGAPPGLRVAVSPETKSTIKKLSALFAIDAFGGGFLTDALVSYWFFRRFGIAESQLALLFFTVHVLNALSHLGAAWLARRIGLIKTMVFTHLPSSIFLIAAAFMPSPRWAIVLFLLRESLVEMDVPTRQSYVAAVVQPEERTFAAGVTNLVRNGAWAAASAVAGVFMQQVAFAAPLLLGGGLKIIYDGLLWRAFRHLAPPEEQKRNVTSLP